MITVGTLIEGRYRVDQLVGQGGFGTVYRGVQLAVDRPIAIKLLRVDPSLQADKRAELLSHFVEEARILGRLRHDCVVRTLDQGIVHDPDLGATPYLIMEWGGDETLRELLAAQGGRALSPESAWPLFRGVVSGLAHAHALGIAHRDLKPSNVMLVRTSDGRLTPRIIDFGIAKSFDGGELPGSGTTRTRSTATAFTPGYAAPEQIASARTGPWTDVHALGLLFVEMLTGRAPYGRDGSEGLAAIDPSRPTPARFGIDVGPFEAVLAKALALRPADRHRDASELLQALEIAARSAGLAAESTKVPMAPTAPAERPAAHDPATTVAPSSHTLQSSPDTGTRTINEAAPREGSRRMLLAAAGVSALTLIGLGAMASTGLLSPPSRRSEKKPDDESGTPSEEPPPSAPPGAPTLATLSQEDLELRAVRAGFTVKLRNVIGSPRQVMLTVEREGATGVLHLVELLLPEPGLATAEVEQKLLPYVGGIVRSYRDGVQPGVAYGFTERTLVLLAWQIDPRVPTWFDALVTGLRVSIRGNTITGPDPATRAAPARAEEPAASRLSELTANELRNRLLKAGADEVHAVTSATFSLRYAPAGQAPKSAEVSLLLPPPASPPGAASRYLARLTSSRTPHTYAWDGDVAIVCEGKSGFDCTAFMKLVLGKLPVALKSSP